jgi:hypothetical protein
MAIITQSSKFWSAGFFCRTHQTINPGAKRLNINKQTLHLNGQHFHIWEVWDPLFISQYRCKLSRPSCFTSFLSCASPTERYTCSITHSLQSTIYSLFQNTMPDIFRQLKRHTKISLIKSLLKIYLTNITQVLFMFMTIKIRYSLDLPLPHTDSCKAFPDQQSEIH